MDDRGSYSPEGQGRESICPNIETLGNIRCPPQNFIDCLEDYYESSISSILDRENISSYPEKNIDPATQIFMFFLLRDVRIGF